VNATAAVQVTHFNHLHDHMHALRFHFPLACMTAWKRSRSIVTRHNLQLWRA